MYISDIYVNYKDHLYTYRRRDPSLFIRTYIYIYIYICVYIYIYIYSVTNFIDKVMLFHQLFYLFLPQVKGRKSAQTEAVSITTVVCLSLLSL